MVNFDVPHRRRITSTRRADARADAPETLKLRVAEEEQEPRHPRGDRQTAAAGGGGVRIASKPQQAVRGPIASVSPGPWRRRRRKRAKEKAERRADIRRVARLRAERPERRFSVGGTAGRGRSWTYCRQRTRRRLLVRAEVGRGGASSGGGRSGGHAGRIVDSTQCEALPCESLS